MPRFWVRSTCTSCRTPFSTTATRDSIGVILIRISSLMAGSRSGVFTIVTDRLRLGAGIRRSARGKVLPTGYAELTKQLRGFAHGQAYHGGIAAIEPGDKHRSKPLNSIAACLILRFAAVPVGCSLLDRNSAKTYPAAYTSSFAALAVGDSNGGEDVMLASRQGHQHRQGVGLVHRFAKDLTINDHGRVGAQHAGAGSLFKRNKTRRSLAVRKALDVGNSGFVCKRSFINGGADHGERHTDLRQQFTPPWGARGQIKQIHCRLSL